MLTKKDYVVLVEKQGTFALSRKLDDPLPLEQVDSQLREVALENPGCRIYAVRVMHQVSWEPIVD